MKTSAKKILLATFIVLVSVTISLAGVKHQKRCQTNKYFEHPALQQLAIAFQKYN